MRYSIEFFSHVNVHSHTSKFTFRSPLLAAEAKLSLGKMYCSPTHSTKRPSVRVAQVCPRTSRSNSVFRSNLIENQRKILAPRSRSLTLRINLWPLQVDFWAPKNQCYLSVRQCWATKCRFWYLGVNSGPLWVELGHLEVKFRSLRVDMSPWKSKLDLSNSLETCEFMLGPGKLILRLW